MSDITRELVCRNFRAHQFLFSRANDVLNTETQMFEKYLKRVEPKDWEKMLNAPQPLVSSTPSTSTNDLISGGRVTRKRSKSRSSTTDRVLKLTAEQKCDIAQREIEEFREEIEKLREDSEKVLDNFRVCPATISNLSVPLIFV